MQNLCSQFLDMEICIFCVNTCHHFCAPRDLPNTSSFPYQHASIPAFGARAFPVYFGIMLHASSWLGSSGEERRD